MTTLHMAVGVASVVGAILFFLGGYLIARSQGVAAKPPLPTDRQQELSKYQERLAEAEKRIVQLERIEDKYIALQRQTQALRVGLEESRGEDASLAERERQDRAMRREVLKQKEAEAESLREERSQLAEQVQALAERVQALSAAERKRQELAIEVERLTAEVHDLERCRGQLADLQGEQEALVALRDTVRELQEENAQLRSRQLTQQAPPQPALPGNPEGLGESLDSFLVRISEREGYRAAVLADQQGLLIAGTGEHAKELAVVAALYDEMASKVPEDLPLSHLQEIHMVDENAVTLAVQPLSVTADRLILVSLSVGPGPDKDSIDQLIRQTTAFMG